MTEPTPQASESRTIADAAAAPQVATPSPEATDAESPEKSAGPPQAVFDVIERLTRYNNVLIFLCFVAALASVAIVQTTELEKVVVPPGWVTTGGRLVAPVLALALTAVYTSRVMHRKVDELGDRPINMESMLQPFALCKQFSMRALALATLFAAICLLWGHRTLDLLLALLPLVLLITTRPGLGTLQQFIVLADTMRSEIEAEKAT